MAKYKVYHVGFTNTAVVPEGTPLEEIGAKVIASMIKALEEAPLDFVKDTGITFHSNSVDKS